VVEIYSGNPAITHLLTRAGPSQCLSGPKNAPASLLRAILHALSRVSNRKRVIVCAAILKNVTVEVSLPRPPQRFKHEVVNLDDKSQFGNHVAGENAITDQNMDRLPHQRLDLVLPTGCPGAKCARLWRWPGQDCSQSSFVCPAHANSNQIRMSETAERGKGEGWRTNLLARLRKVY
jgi:hypothetical protein